MPEQPNTFTEQNRLQLLMAWMPKSFDLMDYLVRMVRSWPLMLSTIGVGLLAGLSYGYFSPRYYASTATFMPPPQEMNASSAAGSSLALLSTTVQGDMYLYLLQTRTLEDDVVKRMQLTKHYKMPQDAARATLIKRSTFDVQHAAVVTVSVRDPDPIWAAKLANGYIDALYRLEGSMVASAFMHRREFFESQLKLHRDRLEAAEDSWSATQTKVGVLDPEVAASAEQGQEVGLQSQIDTLDAQIAVLLQGQTEQSPEVIRLRSQQAALRAQLVRQKNSGLNPNRGIQGLRALPETILQQHRMRRNVTEKTAVYQAVLNRYQLAQAAEIDPGPQFEVVDQALPPTVLEPSIVPKWTLRGAFLGFILGVFLLFGWPLIRQTVTAFLERVRQAS